MMKRGVVIKSAVRLVKRRDSGRRTFVPRKMRYWRKPKAELLSQKDAYIRYRERRMLWHIWLWPEPRAEVLAGGMEFFPVCRSLTIDDETGEVQDRTYC